MENFMGKEFWNLEMGDNMMVNGKTELWMVMEKWYMIVRQVMLEILRMEKDVDKERIILEMVVFGMENGIIICKMVMVNIIHN